jgi:outer membrane receptor protein involved in Fe transport
VERTTSVEYPGLPTEISAPSVDRTEFANSGLRLDKYFAGSRALTLEGGWARTNGGVALTGAGRPQNLGVQRPFVRTAFQASQWRVSGYYDGRHGRMISLATGASTFDNSVRLHGEGQRRFAYANGRGTFVGGGALRYERTDTRDDAGISTVLRDVHANRAAALYGQIDHQVSGRLRAVMAVRFDEGTLHSPQLSPKLGMVYAISPLQRARFTYGHAFQTASFVQYFLRTPAAPSVRLGAVETALRPALGGVALNFDSVPVLALGNDRLKVEKINSVEAGYSALMGGKAMLTGDYYFNRVSDLVTSLLPQVGTSLGRINPQFGAYQPSAVLSTAQQNLVLATLRASLPSSLFAVMSNDLDGSPIFGAVSLTNYSQVHTQGAEIHLQYFASNRIAADAGYTWMHFDTRAQFPEDPLSANTAPHRVMAGATYASERMMGSLRYRWVDAFTWLSGIFRGPVPSYKVVDLAAEYRFASRIRVQLNVANLFDDKHYEVFGGDILRRSTLVTLVRQW